ncbi:hypothetical protein BDN72DRAFT_778483 [Pluteus cervinus]|uniref:Uncharacterized protein n=1 Tax=Pluteus cervinus TaxID=181527 RepID=A0ACD3A7D6_9AGAR|nr:hypothetical protein BDN72DRAFT_778483 [Pluteus cervinus]
MRVPELRTQAGEWWEKKEREGDWIRGDEEVRRLARGVGLAYENKEEGGLRTSARQAVGTLKMAYVPSQYW